MLEIRQVQDAEIKDGAILASVEEDSEKVKEIFGEDKLEVKAIEANPISFGKKPGEHPTTNLVKDPLEIEKEAAKERLEVGDHKLLSGKNFAFLVVAVVALHALFAYFIQTSNKTPQFASITGKPAQEETPSGQNNLLGILGETESPSDSFIKPQGEKNDTRATASDLSAAALGQLSPGAGTANAAVKNNNQNTNNNNGELQDSDILNILKKTD